MTPPMPGDHYDEQLQEVVALLVAPGDREDRISRAREALRRFGHTPKTGSPRVKLTSARMASVFVRDLFVCRYCERRTVLTQVMQLIGTLYPEDGLFPYDPFWKRDRVHPAAPLRSACVDHIIPEGRGGTSDEDNLVTACWLCNGHKADYLLDEVGMQVTPPNQRGWDGLTGQYSELLEVARPQLTPRQCSTHQGWIHCLQQAHAAWTDAARTAYLARWQSQAVA